MKHPPPPATDGHGSAQIPSFARVPAVNLARTNGDRTQSNAGPGRLPSHGAKAQAASHSPAGPGRVLSLPEPHGTSCTIVRPRDPVWLPIRQAVEIARKTHRPLAPGASAQGACLPREFNALACPGMASELAADTRWPSRKRPDRLHRGPLLPAVQPPLRTACRWQRGQV